MGLFTFGKRNWELTLVRKLKRARKLVCERECARVRKWVRERERNRKLPRKRMRKLV